MNIEELLENINLHGIATFTLEDSSIRLKIADQKPVLLGKLNMEFLTPELVDPLIAHMQSEVDDEVCSFLYQRVEAACDSLRDDVPKLRRVYEFLLSLGVQAPLAPISSMQPFKEKK